MPSTSDYKTKHDELQTLIALYDSDDPEKALANIASITGTRSFCSKILRAIVKTITSAAGFVI
jgi:hypothetical protein